MALRSNWGNWVIIPIREMQVYSKTEFEIFRNSILKITEFIVTLRKLIDISLNFVSNINYSNLKY